MRPLSVLFLGSFLLAVSCAHAKPGSEKPSASPSDLKTVAPFSAPASDTGADVVRIEDADGDGVANAQDGCPLDPGETQGVECPAKWGYFFLRVINDERLPVKAALAFQPSVNKMVVVEDGYSGVLRPGTYELRVEAPGYKPSDVTFEVLPEEKALVEVELQRPPGEGK